MTRAALAKERRFAPSDAEHRLWQQLRGNRMASYKLRRQVPIGNDSLGFVCYGLHVIVEVNGARHNGASHDVARDAWLTAQGFVVRFWNNEVFENLGGPLEPMLAQCEALPPFTRPVSRQGGWARSRLATKATKIDTGRARPSLALDGGVSEGEGDASTKSGSQRKRQ
jgi:very-short-patch-repair endonuclease